MDLDISPKEIQEIVKVSYYYYYNPSKWPEELNVISANLRDRIANGAPNTVIERGIITAISFFLDQDFLISVANEFQPNQQPVPNMPENWRNNIANMAVANQNIAVARYFIRRRNQTFVLDVMYDSLVQKVRVNVNHTVVNHKPLTVEFCETDLLGLSDPEHNIVFALHFVNMCSNEWTPMVKKAVQDAPPTAQRTPLH